MLQVRVTHLHNHLIQMALIGVFIQFKLIQLVVRSFDGLRWLRHGPTGSEGSHRPQRLRHRIASRQGPVRFRTQNFERLHRRYSSKDGQT